MSHPFKNYLKTISFNFISAYSDSPLSPKGRRPAGITLLAIIAAFEGIILLFSGMLAIEAGGLISQNLELSLPSEVINLAGWIALLLGVISLLVAYTFWFGKSWGWILGVILSAIWIIGSIADLLLSPFSIFWLILNAIVLFYLTRSHVRAYFKKVSEPGFEL